MLLFVPEDIRYCQAFAHGVPLGQQGVGTNGARGEHQDDEEHDDLCARQIVAPISANVTNGFEAHNGTLVTDATISAPPSRI